MLPEGFKFVHMCDASASMANSDCIRFSQNMKVTDQASNQIANQTQQQIRAKPTTLGPFSHTCLLK